MVGRDATASCRAYNGHTIGAFEIRLHRLKVASITKYKQ